MFLELFLLFAALIVFLTLNSRPKNFPPGPLAFPIIGSILFLGRNPIQKIQLWKRKYGNIFSLKFGSYNAIILNDHDIIKEAYNNDAFLGRPALKPLIALSKGQKRGLVFSEGEVWAEQRRFSLKTLRDSGFGKKSMEGIIHEDLSDLISNLKKQVGESVEVNRIFNLAIVSSLWNIITGERLSLDDPNFKSVLTSIQNLVRSLNLGGPTLFFPFVTKMFPGLSGWNKLLKTVDNAHKFVGERIESHKETFQSDSMRDYTDIYLQEIKDTKDPKSSFYGDEGEANLLISMINLLAAGSETTSNTINWALIYLALNTEIKDKLQKEIQQVVGKSRLPSLDDQNDMPYCQAFMREVFRRSSIAPLGIVHNTMTNVDFHGFQIPKDTIVFVNLYGIHHDESWGDPENFRPERHLSEDGKSLRKDLKPILPFLVGKRSCLGESLARNEFFLFLTGICQSLDFKLDPSKPTPSLDPDTKNILRFPKPFNLIFSEFTNE